MEVLESLLLDALVVIAKKHADWFEVNLEQYNLPVPKYGFVVSFKDFVAPVLAIKTYLKKSTDSWERGLYNKNVWRKDTFSHFGIRARVAEAK